MAWIPGDAPRMTEGGEENDGLDSRGCPPRMTEGKDTAGMAIGLLVRHSRQQAGIQVGVSY